MDRIPYTRLVLAAAVAFSAFPFGAAQADAYTDAAGAACERMKSCALEQMGEVPPEMRPMIEASLDGLCVQMQHPENYAGFSRQHPLYDPATACMKSIAGLSCEQMDQQGGETPECKRLNELAKEYE